MRTAFLVLFAAACAGRSVPAIAPSAGDPELTAIAERARVDGALPGLIAARVHDSEIAAEAVVGFRSLDTLEPFELGDPVHLGSTTKAMTSTLAEILVREGRLDWEATLPMLFPSLTIHDGYRGVTLADLANHRAGLPRDPEGTEEEILAFYAIATVHEQRMELARRVLEQAPPHTPQAESSYSNIGYVLLGLAIEDAAGESFEDAMQHRLFDALGMEGCGFFAPGSSTTSADAPRGHRHDGVVLPPGLDGDLPAVYSSAGLVHCDLGSWALFVGDHIRGAHGEPALLPPESYERLHTPPGESPYAYGWTLATSSRGRVLSHAGSNGYWQARVLIQLDGRTAVLLATNIGNVPDGLLERVMLSIDALE
jgi:D-alanyl-D-alanine carboxypeptidase